jgi:hypothetical protein
VAAACAPIPAADPFPARHGDPWAVFAHAGAMDVPATVAEAFPPGLLVSLFFLFAFEISTEKEKDYKEEIILI